MQASLPRSTLHLPSLSVVLFGSSTRLSQRMTCQWSGGIAEFLPLCPPTPLPCPSLHLNLPPPCNQHPPFPHSLSPLSPPSSQIPPLRPAISFSASSTADDAPLPPLPPPPSFPCIITIAQKYCLHPKPRTTMVPGHTVKRLNPSPRTLQRRLCAHARLRRGRGEGGYDL